MDPYTFGQYLLFALAMVLAAWVAVVALWAHHRRKLAQIAARPAADHPAGFDEMAARLAVIEAIVTDKGYDLAHQIEALRQANPPAKEKV